MQTQQILRHSLLTLAICSSLSACVPLIATGVGMGVTSTIDRRSYNMQMQDQELEVRIMTRLNRQLDEKVNVSTTAVNRWVLLTGQATNEANRAEAEKLARETPNVRQVFNEITVGWPSTVGISMGDRVTTTKIKSRLFDPNLKGVSGHQVKVITEQGVVYLMGLLSESEAKLAIDIARTTSGVNKVVDVIEVLSDEEIRRLNESLPKTETPSKSP